MHTYSSDMLIRDVLTSDARAISIFERHGLPCAGCMAAEMETLSSVASMHEISVDALLKDLNALEDTDSEAKGDA